MPTRLFRFERIPAIEPPIVGDRMCNLIVVHCLELHGCWDCMIALFAVGRGTFHTPACLPRMGCCKWMSGLTSSAYCLSNFAFLSVLTRSDLMNMECSISCQMDCDRHGCDQMTRDDVALSG